MNKRLILIASLVFFISMNLFSFAQEQATEKSTEAPPVKLPEQKIVQPAELKAKPQAKETACACLEAGIALVQKAYISLEEDEWPVAIKNSSDALDSINKLSKTCKCPELPIYQNIAKAYLNYAKAGNLLDGEEEPNCKVAKKLYQDSINWLEKSITKVATEVSSNAKSIKDYATEELQFVIDECEESEPIAKDEKSKSPAKKN